MPEAVVNEMVLHVVALDVAQKLRLGLHPRVREVMDKLIENAHRCVRTRCSECERCWQNDVKQRGCNYEPWDDQRQGVDGDVVECTLVMTDVDVRAQPLFVRTCMMGSMGVDRICCMRGSTQVTTVP